VGGVGGGGGGEGAGGRVKGRLRGGGDGGREREGMGEGERALMEAAKAGGGTHGGVRTKKLGWAYYKPR
jgi:hypothetical protein